MIQVTSIEFKKLLIFAASGECAGAAAEASLIVSDAGGGELVDSSDIFDCI
jgi:hypothetical protein